jgi:hypothetical protein
MKKIFLIICIFLITTGAIPKLAHAQTYIGDLSLNESGVRTVGSVLSGRIVRIYATVTNNSAQDLFGVVKFYDENKGSFIDSDQPVSVLANKTDDVFVDWTAGSVGSHPISVRVIPWNESGDDPSNNKVTKTIYVDVDSDGDGIGDSLDGDDDNDGVPDREDDFPLDSSESKDTDNDGIGDNTDTDDDNDGVSDIEDIFPLDKNESKDSDGDQIGDNSDAFPSDPNESIDSDKDGLGDNSDPNDENHGPIVEIGVEKTVINAGEIVAFNALRSRDPDGEIVTIEWDFGDGVNATGVVVDHVYENIGKYDVTLKAVDDKGESREQTVKITVIYKWQTIALILVTTLIILLLVIPWLFSRRKDEEEEFKEEIHKVKPAKKKKALLKKKK